jgi:uncharacterized 2Fe-2S/4Fe-4S cluster protein (DUF4445 family)
LWLSTLQGTWQLSPGAYIYLLPNIAGYVGADHSAVILSTEPWEEEGIMFVIDKIELSLKVNDRILSCSCASSPAFEGAHIKDGIRAAAWASQNRKNIRVGYRSFKFRNWDYIVVKYL